MPDYFTLEELGALPNMTEGRYSAARKEAAAAWAVGIIEREVGTSFVARTVTETYDGGGHAIVLRKRYVLSVTSAEENGIPVTDTLRVRNGILRRYAAAGSSTPARWADGVENIEVTYVAGYTVGDEADPVPADVKEAALQATRWRLLATNSNSDLNARQTSITNEMGGTVNFAVAGPDRPTGYPDVDAVIMGWKRRLNTVTYP